MRNFKHLIYKIIKRYQNKTKAIDFYLKPYFPIVEKKLAKEKNNTNCAHTDNVWTMWLQEEVPNVVQMCINTILEKYPNATIITEKNVDEFINIPSYIKEKYNKGIISAPHYSDYIRTVLLDEYGGLWLDASLYMLDRVPTFITSQDFFVLTGKNKKSISNFFIYSVQGHYIIKTIRIFLEEYWKKENFAIDYFFYHKFFLLMCKKNKKYGNYYKKMQPWLNTQVKYLVDHPNIDFSEPLWEYLSKTGFMYKINRKNDVAMNNKNGFFQYLLRKHNYIKEGQVHEQV